MNAFRGLSRGIVPELESAWLFKIAHNVCLSRRRSSWRRGKIEAPNNFEVLQEIIPGRDETVGDELIRLQDVLEEMPENQRRAILLREWQGLTYREISAAPDLPARPSGAGRPACTGPSGPPPGPAAPAPRAGRCPRRCRSPPPDQAAPGSREKSPSPAAASPSAASEATPAVAPPARAAA